MRLPYGYRRSPKIRSGDHNVVPAEADQVEEMFRLYAFSVTPCYSLKDLIDKFTAEGKLTRTGRVWSRAGIAAILHNRKYVGGGKFPKITTPIAFNMAQTKLTEKRKR